MALQGLTIGQAAKAAGVTRKAMRVYEAKGLLPVAERTATGYRLYDQCDIDLLIFIRQARALGLHLHDIRNILAIRNGGVAPCTTVRELLNSRIAEIDTTVAELLALRNILVDTRQQADAGAVGRPATVCGLIESTESSTGIGDVGDL